MSRKSNYRTYGQYSMDIDKCRCTSCRNRRAEREHRRRKRAAWIAAAVIVVSSLISCLEVCG